MSVTGRTQVAPTESQVLRDGSIVIETGRVESPSTPITVDLQGSHGSPPAVVLDSEIHDDDDSELFLTDSTATQFSAQAPGGVIGTGDPPGVLHYVAVSGAGTTDISELARAVAQDVAADRSLVNEQRAAEIAIETWAPLAIVGFGAVGGIAGAVGRGL